MKKGNIVYIIREIADTLEFGQNEILKLKLGKAKDMKKRKNTIDTSLPYRSQVLKSIVVKDKEAIESCLKNKMSEYVIIADKEYYECSYNKMIAQLALCINFFEGIDIDLTPNKYTEQARENIFGNAFDPDKKMKIYLEDNDSGFDSNYDSDSDYESSNDIDTSDGEYQSGGGSVEDANRLGYLKYKLKYLTLLNDMK